MTNKQIARVLKETAALIELTGGNAFRARAFASAARTIERMEGPAADRLAAGTLTDEPGIGAGLAAQIEELVERGSFDLLDDLLASIPPGLPEVLRVKGLGVKKVRRLWQELDVTSLEALEAAAAAGRLETLDGFGAKTQANVLARIEELKRYRGRRRYADAYGLAQEALGRLRALPGVVRAEPAGALRRRLETVDRLAFTVATTDRAATRAALASLAAEAPGGDGASGDASDVFTGRLPDGFRLEVRLADPARFGTAWWRHTGAPAHVTAYETAYGAPPDAPEERDVWIHADLVPIPPDLREGDGELEAAAANRLPRLLTVRDLRGSLHNHSTYSDGTHTLREMAEAARALGLSYFGICDHSQSLAIANGLAPERVAAQQDEIRALNAAFAADDAPPFRIFSGIESDILADGSLDYPDEVLATFDFIVASVHQGFNMTEDQATERVIRAVENPYTRILGHATGRLLLSREGYPLDHARVIDACAANGVAIELNANPYRLDMDWRWLRRAAECGVLVAINPDAHAMDGLRDVRWGVAVARKAWLTPEGCLNAKDLDDFTRWIDAGRPA